MLTASAAYTAALLNSHIARVRVRAYRRAFTAPSTWTTTLLGVLPVVGGSVTIDGQANVWHTARIDVANDTVYADGTAWFDLLNAWDTVLTVEYGVQTDYDLDDQAPVVEFVKVAEMRIDRTTLAQTTDVIAVEASDDGTRVSEYDITEPWPAVGADDLAQSVIDTIAKLITDCYPTTDPPSVTVDESLIDSTWADSSIFQGDRLACIDALAESLGAWVHCDEDNDWVIEPVPYALGAADWVLDTGSGGTVVTWDVGTDRTQMANRVIVRFELPFAGSQRAVATDTTSPTRWDGPAGRIVRIVDNDTCQSTAEAQAAADTLLAQLQGRAATVSVSASYCPLLVPGDTVSVPLPDGSTELQWVDSVTLPIPAGVMTIKTRVVEVSS